MRIAVWHNLPSGGGKRALYNHVKALKEAGHELEAWTTDYASQSYFPLAELISEKTDPILQQVRDAEKLTLPTSRAKKLYEVLHEYSKRTVKQIEDAKFDVIFANSCGITYMPLLGHYARIPVIVYLGEPDRQLYEASQEGNIWELPKYGFGLRAMNRYRRDFFWAYAKRIKVREEVAAAKSVHRILVNSFYSAESVKRAYGINSRVCYLGVNESDFKPAKDLVKKNYVVGMGRISEVKNIDLALHVLSEIPADIRPEMHWISNGFAADYLAVMKTLAEKLEVIFHTHIDVSDHVLQEIVSEAAVMIYTSRLEPFGLAPLEANMCGTAVVAIAEGGVRETIQNGVNGFVVGAEEVHQMAQHIIRFVSDTRYAADMGNTARQHAVNNWGWKKMSDTINAQFVKK